MDLQLKNKVTAQEYKDGLPKTKKGVIWTMETFSVYVNLLYPHITVADGQEWKGVRTKYKFVCEIHGLYTSPAQDLQTAANGCRCKGCQSDKKTASAGKLRSPRATKEEKELAAKLSSDGLSYSEIGRQLGRWPSTIQYWLDSEHRESHSKASTKWNSENTERHRAASRRYNSEFEHGRARKNAINANRRLLAQNTPEYVFFDNQWHEVDRRETYRVFKDFLLPPSEKKEIQELYLESQHLTETTGVEHHVDHIQPLSKGGEHSMLNLQVIPAEENLSKHDTFRTEDQELLVQRLFNHQ